MKAFIIPNDALCTGKVESCHGFLNNHKTTQKHKIQDTVEEES